MPETSRLIIPRPERPLPLEGYGIPEGEAGLLDWDFVSARMAQSRNYWIATTGPNGRPHARPVWGIWLDNLLHFGGGPNTRWSRNLNHDPRVVAHCESGDEAVIIEGVVNQITDPESPYLKRLDDAYEAKYNLRHGPPVWVLHPHKVFAWKEYPTSVTRWVFRNEE